MFPVTWPRALPALGLLAAAALPAWAEPVIRQATGASAADVAYAVDRFRQDLGGGTQPGREGLFSDQAGQRREIDWDDVPDRYAAPRDLPGDFFNRFSPRGVRLSTPGSGLQVSGRAGGRGGVPAVFANLDDACELHFAAFSPDRLLTPLESNVVEVRFRVPGTETPATVRGFGAVFCDVDIEGAAFIEYFDAAGQRLLTLPVPATPGERSFSFLGVHLPDGPAIARVRITAGTHAIGTAREQIDAVEPVDLVALDDILFAEPVAMPAATPLPAGLRELAASSRGANDLDRPRMDSLMPKGQLRVLE